MKFGQILFGILWFFVAVAITIVMFRMGFFQALGNLFEDIIAYAIYWAGVVLFIAFTDFIIPIIFIVDGYKGADND